MVEFTSEYWLARNDQGGDTPVGVYLVGLYVGAQAFPLFLELFEANLAIIQQHPVLAGVHLFAGLIALAIAVTIFQRRPIGLVGGIGFAAFLLVAYIYYFLTEGSHAIMGVLIGLVIIGYFWNRSSLFFE